MPASTKFPTTDELAYHKLYRDRVVNEDTLIYHRLSWFLSIQAILFVLWTAMLRGSEPVQGLLRLITTGMFCGLGLFICFVTGLGIWAAQSEITHLQIRYEKQHPSPHPMLPPIIGNPNHHFLGMLPPFFLIATVAAGWVVVWAFLA